MGKLAICVFFRWRALSFQVKRSNFKYVHVNLCQPSILLWVAIQNDNSCCSYAILLCKCVRREKLRKLSIVANWEFVCCLLENIWVNRQILRSIEIFYKRHVQKPHEIICLLHILFILFVLCISISVQHFGQHLLFSNVPYK